MDIEAIREQDTKAWPGKIALVVRIGAPTKHMSDIDAALQRGFTTTAVILEGAVETQSDLPITAKKIKLKNRLVRVHTNGTNPEQLKTLIDRKVVDYVSLLTPAPLYAEAYAKVGARGFDRVRESVQLLTTSATPHETVLELNPVLGPGDIKDAASQVSGSFVLYSADKSFDELRAIAAGLAGPKSIRIRNRNGEQVI